MMKRFVLAGAVCGLLLFTLAAVMPGTVLAAENDHSYFLQGPMETGPEVTAQCLKCHEKHAEDFMKTTHWTWAQDQLVGDKNVVRGKKNAINNFCTSIAGNEPRCTSCHAGYGWTDDSFDFTNPGNIDCLVCHDTTGTYVKEADRCGQSRQTRRPGLRRPERRQTEPLQLRHLPLLRRRRRRRQARRPRFVHGIPDPCSGCPHGCRRQRFRLPGVPYDRRACDPGQLAGRVAGRHQALLLRQVPRSRHPTRRAA